MGKLDGKVCIITGGSGGIGLTTGGLFAREGGRVLLVDLDADKLAQAAASLGDGAAWEAADVTSEEDTRRYVRAAVDRFGGVDVLFANAGIEGKVAPLVSQEQADFDRVLAVNVRGVWLAIKHAAPEIAKRGGGSIVATSSVAGLVGSAGLGPYVASKHAVIGLVRTAAIELAPQGVRVNSIHPGPIENRMMRSIEGQAGEPSSVKQGFLGMIPMGRYGTNDEIARLVLFLASDASSYCTGAAFVADGGFVAM